jgi:hypothetical protein
MNKQTFRYKFIHALEIAGFPAECEARGKAEGEKIAWEEAITLLKQGCTVEQLEGMDPVKLHSWQKPTIEDVLEEYGFPAVWEVRGEIRGEAKGEKTAWEKAITLLKQGYTVEQLERMDPAGPFPRQKPKGSARP